MVNVWGVVVIVRSPYRWLDDFFGNQPPSSKFRNETEWDPFLRKYSHMWRSFVEHWLLDEEANTIPLWASRSDGVKQHLFTEGPLREPLSDEGEEGEEDKGEEGNHHKGSEIIKEVKTPKINYFLVKYESLVKRPNEIALEILDWSKEVVTLNKKSEQLLMHRAEKCGNFGNVVGRMAKSHLEPKMGLGPRFKISDDVTSDPTLKLLVNDLVLERRKVVYDHTIPYLCAFGHQSPQELPC
eukprot:CAMPEP_0114334836 /NCGR_PEP_ID=MMETSP0101-20121206/4649_1 /TAXON_ID=38822 ORGANISM="Pteridomonas danica, Strain PT" /NCGR_SAMPLE_ID=MMETSP0101 /ASSEMBLY_ACC=CAM_ASM_000211 /LENGTH=239 /DNA_ID=CAMNT_0001466245 /DNA_START=209 /DNA_END=928 /DNA_ORIENTATION=-